MGHFRSVNSKDVLGKGEVALVLDLFRGDVVVIVPAGPVRQRVAVRVLNAEIQSRIFRHFSMVFTQIFKK